MGSTKAIPFEGVAYIFFDASKGGTPKKSHFHSKLSPFLPFISKDISLFLHFP